VQSSNSVCNIFSVFIWALIFSLGMIKGAVAQQPGVKDSQSSTSTAPFATKQQPTGDAAAGQVKPAPTPDPTTSADASSGNKQKAPPGLDPKTGIPLYQTIQEDWSTLAIGTSKLEPETPIVAQTDEANGFTRTLVQLKWRPGDALDLYVILPKDVKNPPAILYLYGYKEDTDRFQDDAWCERATRSGTAAIGFTSALSGHRFHDRPLEQWFVSELQETLGSTVHDVKFILDYLAQRGDVDMKRVGMFGQASGGAIALLAAAADARIKVVDVLDPWGDWPVWLANSPIVKEDPHGTDFAKPEFLSKVEPLDPVKWLPTLKSTRIRIQQVMDNPATPNVCKDALRDAAPKHSQIVRFEHVGDLSKAAGQGHLFEWIKTELKGLPPSAAPQSGAALLTRGNEYKKEPEPPVH
jgi:hypothetical protein